MATSGRLYDGSNAHPHAVEVEADDGGLRLVTADGHSLAVDAALLTRTDTGEGARLGRSDRPGWRLLLDDPVDPEVEALLPGHSRYGRWIDRIGLGKAAAVFGVVAAAVVAVGYAAPAFVAPLVPYSWERNLGTAITGDFGDLRCRNSEGQQALEAMVRRIDPTALGDGEQQVRIAALNVPMFNAAALPGGQIVVFKPAITEVERPEELAGILAHEIAHVRRRHVSEALVRELGIGALIRLFAGDIGANAQQIMSLSYTRANEEEADRDAIAMLARAGIDPRHTGALFKRLSKEEGRLELTAEWLSSHPDTGGRADRFARSYRASTTYSPVLTREQADALFNICRKRPKRA